jgi:hypothetical protein
MADTSAPPSPTRPRPAILAALAVALVALVTYSLWPAASQPAAPSNAPRDQRKQAAATKGTTDAGALQVELDALRQPPPAPDDETARNPFRFYVKPPPPPPPAPKPIVVPPPKLLAPGDEGYVPPGPPPPPPITLKFIGTLEVKGRKVAIFSDNRGIPVYAAEGEVVMGQYRVVKIGVESVTLEYLDGRGRQIIPMRG